MGRDVSDTRNSQSVPMPPADDDSDVPLPPPPPFPPPPQARSEDDSKPNKRPAQSSGQVQKPKKRKDFREILALFHDESMDAAQVERVWSALWQTTLAESQEDHKRHHHQQEQEKRSLKRKKSGDRDHGPVATRDALARHSNLAKDSFKRARQVRQVACVTMTGQWDCEVWLWADMDLAVAELFSKHRLVRVREGQSTGRTLSQECVERA